MPTCRVCQRDYIYDDEQGYDRELCGPMCDGIEFGRKQSDSLRDDLRMEREAHMSALNRNAELRSERDHLAATLEQVESILGGCRLTLDRISKGEGRFSRDPLRHAENTIDDMKSLAINGLKSIAARNSSDPLLANIEQGVRDGLAHATS